MIALIDLIFSVLCSIYKTVFCLCCSRVTYVPVLEICQQSELSGKGRRMSLLLNNIHIKCIKIFVAASSLYGIQSKHKTDQSFF
jgi:hypothetical protein